MNRMVRHNFPIRDKDYKTNRNTPHDLNGDTEEHCFCAPQVLEWKEKDNGRMGWVVVVEGGGQKAFDGSLEPKETA